MAGQTYAGNELVCGIGTQVQLDAQPPHLLVESVGYDSAFRGSGLKAGDRIVAIDGEPLRRLSAAELAVQSARLPGQYQETQRWQEAGRKEGDRVVFRVRRKAEGQGWRELEVSGLLRHPLSYRDERNTPLLCENGPGTYDTDGFSEAWPSWVERLGKQISAIACAGRWRPGLSSRYEYKSLLEQQPRVELLAQKYPGPYASALREDFLAALETVRGKPYVLGEAELAYRKADEERIAQVAAAAKTAWQDLLQAHAGETIAAFPAEHPVHGRREAVVGKCVVLERLPTTQWVAEVKHGWFAAGSDRDGWYFLDMESEPALRMLRALRRYQKLVSNRITEEYTLLTRILPDARLLAIDKSGHWGLQVELLAACIGDALCVDAAGAEAQPPFAGEAALLLSHTQAPAADAAPAQVLEAMIAAIKADDLALWKSLFADWMLRANPDGSLQVCYLMQEARDEDFERSRASFSGRLFDARVAWIGDVRVLTDGKEFEGAARVEEVEAEIEDIGSFDGEYRGFTDVTVNRYWTLQRIDGGPWRIASIQNI